MTPRHALPSPPPRRHEAPVAPRQELQAPVYRERDHDLRSETLDEGECFEQLLLAAELEGQGVIADYSGEHGGNGSGPHHAVADQDAPAPPCEQTAELWKRLLARLDDCMPGAHEGAVEAQLELPNLGMVAMRVIPRGSDLDIVLRFAESTALRACDVHRQASAAWLGEQLGRRVTLTLHGEVH